jgi:hypothetical protein
MASPGTRRVVETPPNPQSVEPGGLESAAPELTTEAAAQLPDSAAIAEESAAIYPDTNEGAPSPEDIAIEAYRIYMAGGARDGHDLDHWLEAERRLSNARRANPS